MVIAVRTKDPHIVSGSSGNGHPLFTKNPQIASRDMVIAVGTKNPQIVWVELFQCMFLTWMITRLCCSNRYPQSVAFRDMVIADRTKNRQIVSGYSGNGHPVFTNTRELERPLIGLILQSMWGISPTHLSWSSRQNNTRGDYTWSIGKTLFGPFSKMSSLSFVQKDPAWRNVLLTTLNCSISSAIDVLYSIETCGGDGFLLKRFIQIWNLFKYKQDKAVFALSHLNFEMAFFHLRSSDHDLDPILSIVYHVDQEIEASLVCFRDPPFPWDSVSLSVGAFFFLIFVYARRDKLSGDKRNQFRCSSEEI